jgi:hypothetical protein
LRTLTLLVFGLAGCKTTQSEPPPGSNCPSSFEDTFGERSVAQVAWDRGILGCLFGCGAEEPIAAGSRAALQVLDWDTIGEFTVESESPEVATFEHDTGSSYVIVDAVGPGTAVLVLRDAATGDVVDRVGIGVVAIVGIETTTEWQNRLLLFEGGSMRVGIALEDESGCRPVGIGAVEDSFDGPVGEEPVTIVSALADWIVSVLVGSVDEYVDVTAAGPGNGTLHAVVAGGPSLDLPLGVVDASAVHAIELQAAGDPVVGSAFSVGAVARDADGEVVHAPLCAWSYGPADAPITDVSEARDTFSFTPQAATSLTVTCAIGTASASLPIEVP